MYISLVLSFKIINFMKSTESVEAEKGGTRMVFYSFLILWVGFG